MLIITSPDLHEKVAVLGQQAQYDLCEAQGRPVPDGEDSAPPLPDVSDAVTTVIGQGGRRVPMLRILQTSACEKNCYYCPFRAGRRFRRNTLQPDELAAAFDQMQRKRLVEGLFLSSGITGTTRSMDRMLDTVELVRRKYGWRGYVHLKLLPNAEDAHIEQAARLADRLSVNLEAPNEARLAQLAPKKDFTQGLVATLERAWTIVRRLRHQGRRVTTAGAVTQYVVGPAGESDEELLVTSQRLYRQAGVRRAYYSAFHPISDTPLVEAEATSPRREHRLYQADFMLRQYGFSADELPYDAQGNLPTAQNPKLVWAERHPEYFPVELNRAPLAMLLRVPGIGPTGAAALMQARRLAPLREIHELEKLGIRAQQAAPFILLAGRAPVHQLRLFT
ncbi:MAG: radical SAM protein [Caldilineales bacterium]